MSIIDHICICTVFVLFFGMILYVFYCMFYKEEHEYLKTLNKIPFKSFVAFYNIAPTKWGLNNNYVIYETTNEEALENNQIAKEHLGIYFFGDTYKTSKKTYEFTFKLTNLIQYRIWHKSILHNEKIKQKKYEQEQLYKQYQDALKEISKDLEQFKQLKPWEDMR